MQNEKVSYKKMNQTFVKCMVDELKLKNKLFNASSKKKAMMIEMWPKTASSKLVDPVFNKADLFSPTNKKVRGLQRRAFSPPAKLTFVAMIGPSDMSSDDISNQLSDNSVSKSSPHKPKKKTKKIFGTKKFKKSKFKRPTSPNLNISTIKSPSKRRDILVERKKGEASTPCTVVPVLSRGRRMLDIKSTKSIFADNSF